MPQNWSMERLMDLLTIGGVGLVAFVVGALLGWLITRSRFTTRVTDLNSKLVLERRVNKQLSEAIQVAAVPTFMPAPDLTTPREPAREPMVLSG
jgi:hypothetical protein